MAVQTTTEQLSRAEARTWIEQRGIDRLPAHDEQLQFVPAGSYNQFNLERAGSGFALTSHVLS